MYYRNGYILKEPEYEKVLLEYLERHHNGLYNEDYLNKEGNLFYVDSNNKIITKINYSSCSHNFEKLIKITRYSVLHRGNSKYGKKIIDYLVRKGGINKYNLDGCKNNLYYFIDEYSKLINSIELIELNKYSKKFIITYHSKDDSFYEKPVYVEGHFLSDYSYSSSLQKYHFISNPKYDIKVDDICKIYNRYGEIFSNLFKITAVNQKINEKPDVSYYMINPKQVKRNGEWIDIKDITINNIKNKKEMKTNKMMSGFLSKLKAMYVPQKEDSVKLSMNGVVCVPVGDEYVGIDNENNLVSYPAEMCMDIPVYTMVKPVNKIQVGDVIKRGNSYAKVIEKKDNTLRCLSYSGYIQNKKEVTDFLMNQAVERVVMNIFTMTDTNLNPMMFALMNEDSNVNMKDLFMMQMMQGNQGNAQGNMAMNPMMLMCMSDSEDGKSNSMMEMMMLSQMMGGQNNPFSGMFGITNTPSNDNTTPNV